MAWTAALGLGQRRVLAAHPRSRSRPLKRKLEPLNPVQLFSDELIGWRLAGAAAASKSEVQLIAEIRAQEQELRDLSDEELDRALSRESLPASALLGPRGHRLQALVLELMRRMIGFPLRDNQLECARALLAGHCVELRTGEGKTYAAGLAALLAGKVGVSSHVITVNEYLAARDHDYIAPIAARLGLKSDVVKQEMDDADRLRAYDCDIVYGANKTFVFDHLRDEREAHTHPGKARRQTGQILAVIDEADSVLVDDATVPMILSEPSASLPPEDVELFYNLTDFAASLREGHEISRDPSGAWRLSKTGVKALEQVAQDWRHPVARGVELIELAEKAISARLSFREGEAWVRAEDAIEMIDQSTGRLMPDRKWDYGMQQLVEITAGVTLSDENRTVGQVTQQSFFRQYDMLCGLTGTAKECRAELWAIYRLAVRPVSPHAPSKLKDLGMQILPDAEAKWQRILARATELSQAGRAVLIGLNDVREAQALADVFEGSGLDFCVLDARSEAEEAALVEVAGRSGRVTIATHLAGRGTDISPDAGALATGGLHVIIGSAMASARLERQLCGRAGRKGQPGSHEQIISLTDRMLHEGERSLWRSAMMGLLKQGIRMQWALARIQAMRDARARHARRRALMREQKLVQQLGYR